MVKNFGGKKVWRKGCFARIGKKKLWRMLTCIANQSLTIKRSQMKQLQTIVLLAWPNHFLAHAGRYRL